MQAVIWSTPFILHQTDAFAQNLNGLFMLIGSCYFYFASWFFFILFFAKEVLQLWWFFFCLFFDMTNSFQGGSMVKNLPADPADARVRSLRWEDPLKEEMATHTSIPAWRIPWTKEPGELQTMRSQRVKSDATNRVYVCMHACTHTHTHTYTSWFAICVFFWLFSRNCCCESITYWTLSD